MEAVSDDLDLEEGERVPTLHLSKLRRWHCLFVSFFYKIGGGEESIFLSFLPQMVVVKIIHGNICDPHELQSVRLLTTDPFWT